MEGIALVVRQCLGLWCGCPRKVWVAFGGMGISPGRRVLRRAMGSGLPVGGSQSLALAIWGARSPYLGSQASGDGSLNSPNVGLGLGGRGMAVPICWRCVHPPRCLR